MCELIVKSVKIKLFIEIEDLILDFDMEILNLVL